MKVTDNGILLFFLEFVYVLFCFCYFDDYFLIDHCGDFRKEIIDMFHVVCGVEKWFCSSQFLWLPPFIINLFFNMLKAEKSMLPGF